MRDSGKDPLVFALDRLRDHDLLIFDDGLHTAVEPFEFYQRLIRDPVFHRQVKFVFLEVFPINLQPAVDAYMAADREDATLLFRLFRDDYTGAGMPYKTYFDLFRTVREVNKGLPKDERIQVSCVSNPVHWPDIKTAEDVALFRKGLAGRDALMYEVILAELDSFRSGRKGIFLTNTRHAYKAIRDTRGRLYWNCGTYFHERHPGKTYSLRCHEPVLSIERDNAKESAKPATAEGMERFSYHWERPGRGLWDEAWRQIGNKPIAVPLVGNAFGAEPYVGNHMRDVAPGQTYADAYDAVLFLAPLETLRQTATVGDIYTPEFRSEVARRYRLLFTDVQRTQRIKDSGAKSLEEVIAKDCGGTPERPLAQSRDLPPFKKLQSAR